MKVVIYPEDILCKACRELTQDEVGSGQVDGTRIDELSERMAFTMASKGGVGLAAPQVGLPIRLFVCQTSSAGKLLCLVNPVIRERDGKVQDFEGCLSLPGLSASVERSKTIVVEGISPRGEFQRHAFSDFEARVVQHEVDHLDGVVFIQHLSDGDYAKLMRNVRNISSPPKPAMPSPRGTIRNIWSSPKKKR